MILDFEGKQPQLHKSAWVADGVVLIGDVELAEDVNVWYGSILRADVGKIRIGARTNVQDMSMLHLSEGMSNTIVGEDCTIGHRATLHGCIVGNTCLIGMGATVLDNAKIGDNSIVGAGALVPSNKEFPPNVMLMGAPAKVTRELNENEIQYLRFSASHYVELARKYTSNGYPGQNPGK